MSAREELKEALRFGFGLPLLVAWSVLVGIARLVSFTLRSARQLWK